MQVQELLCEGKYNQPIDLERHALMCIHSKGFSIVSVNCAIDI